MLNINFRFLVLAIVLPTAGLGGLATLDQAATAQVPENLNKVARERVKQRSLSPNALTTVLNSARVEYLLQGKIVFDFKVMDNSSGAVYGITLDPNGKELDSTILQADEKTARIAKYGRIEPALTQKLAEVSTEQPLEVIIWLKEPPYNGPKRLDPKERTKEPLEVQAFFEQVDAQRAAAVEPVVTPVVNRLKNRGYDVKTDKYSPVIYARLKANEIREIAQESEVDQIYLSPLNQPELDMARQTIGVPLVNTTYGITGTNIRVAQIEVGADTNGDRVNDSGVRIAQNNPFLAGVTQDITYACPNASLHATGVAGIIRSTQATHRGIAPNALLWAGGSCSGSTTELQNRSTAAVNWGTRALNLSWGADIGLVPGVHERFYDSMVINQFRTIVKSSGNQGAAGCVAGTNGNVTSPGLAYNIITVGNFDDRNTFLWNDDVMAPCSSWRNPSSTRGDRQKPDIAAPGTNINSTTTALPWTGGIGSGTSYAAPMVTGAVALLLQTNSGLLEWPEAIRAILMTSALHNVEGSTRLSEFDGAGGIDVSWAHSLARRASGSNWGAQTYSCSTASTLDVASMVLGGNKQTRATIAWDNDPAYGSYSSQPSADLDLQVISPSGAVVASSTSYDNTYEIIDFNTTVSGTYKLRVNKFRCDYSPRYLGWAWQQWQ